MTTMAVTTAEVVVAMMVAVAKATETVMMVVALAVAAVKQQWRRAQTQTAIN